MPFHILNLSFLRELDKLGALSHDIVAESLASAFGFRRNFTFYLFGVEFFHYFEKSRCSR
jgi:hypothetical protein